MPRVILVTLLTLALAGAWATPAAAADLTIDTAQAFLALDGSLQDDDGVADGCLTVLGNLTIGATGSIHRKNDAPAAVDCHLCLDVGGDLRVLGGGSISTERSTGTGNGGNICILVGGAMMLETGAVITASRPTGTGTGKTGDIRIEVAKEAEIQVGAKVIANTSASSKAGNIEILSGKAITIDGAVESILSSGSTGSGANPPADSGTITLMATCKIVVGPEGNVTSHGRNRGADLVHLEACEVFVHGLVESSGPGHHANAINQLGPTVRPDKPTNSVSGIEVWAGDALFIDGELNADHGAAGGNEGTGWIDLFARGNVQIVGDTVSGEPFAVHANGVGGSGASGEAGGIVTVKSAEGSVVMSGRALQSSVAGGSNGDGGMLVVEAHGDVDMDEAVLEARANGIGGTSNVGGTIRVRSFHGVASWTSGSGDVRPTGTAVTTVARRGTIVLQDCAAGLVDRTGSTFPVIGTGTATTPSELADDCTGTAPALPCEGSSDPLCTSYVELPPGGCKEECERVNDLTQWCSQGAVLSMVAANIGGEVCAMPDILVDVRAYDDAAHDADCRTVDPSKVATDEAATCSLQAAVDYMNANGDLNGDGFLFIGVVATDGEETPGFVCGEKSRPPAGGSPFGVENVVITNVHPERLNVFACSVTIHAADPTLPVITVAESVGKVTVLGLHVEQSDVAGYKVEAGNEELVVIKNSRAIDNDLGYWVVDDYVEVTGSGIDHNRVGVLVAGTDVTLRNNNHIDENAEHGIVVTGDDNVIRNCGMEENGRHGMYVTGARNLLLDNDADMNFDCGFVVVEDDGAAENVFHGNSAEKNVDHGILACGQIDDGGNKGQKNGGVQCDFVCPEGPAVFYVADEQDDRVYVYNALVQCLGSFETAEDNGAPNGIAVDGEHVLVIDKSDRMIYRYSMTGGETMTSRMLQNAAGGSLSNPTGLALDGDDLWLADDGKARLYRFSMAAVFDGAGGGVRALQEIAFTRDNGSVEGLAMDAAHLYVVDDGDKQVYRYPRAGGVAVRSRTLREAGGGGLGSPSGAALEGGALWVADRSRDKVYGYMLGDLFVEGDDLSAAAEAPLNPENADPRGM